MRSFHVILLALALLGCDGERVHTTPSPTPECVDFGARCALPDGPTGICESRPCAPGEQGPCLVCTSQH